MKKVENLYEFCKQVLNIPDAHRLIADYTIVSEDQDNKTLMVLHLIKFMRFKPCLLPQININQGRMCGIATGSGKTLTSLYLLAFSTKIGDRSNDHVSGPQRFR